MRLLNKKHTKQKDKIALLKKLATGQVEVDNLSEYFHVRSVEITWFEKKNDQLSQLTNKPSWYDEATADYLEELKLKQTQKQSDIRPVSRTGKQSRLQKLSAKKALKFNPAQYVEATVIEMNPKEKSKSELLASFGVSQESFDELNNKMTGGKELDLAHMKGMLSIYFDQRPNEFSHWNPLRYR